MKDYLLEEKRSYRPAVFLSIGIAVLVVAAILFAPKINAGSNSSASAANALRSNSAMTARGQAMAAYYAAREAARAQRSRAADAARWQALGNAYAAARVRTADAARWQAGARTSASNQVAARLRENGQAYAAQQAAARSAQASAARWQAMAVAYAKQVRTHPLLGGQ